MKNIFFAVLIPFSLLFSSCVVDAVEDAKKTLDQVKGLKDAIPELEKLANELKNDEVKDPVNFRDLKKALPTKFESAVITDAEGETSGAAGFSISRASGKYNIGNGILKVEIIDAGGIGMAKMALAAWSLANIDKETSRGYEKTGDYNGNKTFEKCNYQTNFCEVNVMLAERFYLNITGAQVDVATIKNYIDEIDIESLVNINSEDDAS